MQRPVVAPPLQSTAIRTIEETGKLSGLQDLGTGRGASAAPSGRLTAGEAQEPAAPQPAVQRQPVQRQPVQRQPAQRQSPQREPEQHQPAERQAAPGDGGQVKPVQRQSLKGLPTRQAGESTPVREPDTRTGAFLESDVARRPWPPVEPSQSGTSGVSAIARMPQIARPATPAFPDSSSPDLDAFEQRISAPDQVQPDDSGPQVEAFVDELPRWDAITAVPSASHSPRALSSAERDDDLDDEDFDDDDDFEDEEIDHEYTWLHYLILVALAVVLGLIIWKVGLEGSGNAAAADSSSVAGIALLTGRTPDLFL
ncbi:hypothetical protein [Sanguibacter antarcticus]|uniref:Uncharacterized protein n=1 Tax=Sanguibacter antarcticus TaxID=372484 RepID=A0A2A9E2D0_9MICO|nr:hypothetical protein [Sanguibacter antarcticus]PFG32741.1 hypothetical protein ATL42_0587 [Sanguibacter antarcticus]